MVNARRWMVTLNQIDQNMTICPDIIFDEDKVRFAIWQLERGEHVHIQMYVEFKNNTSHGIFKKMWNDSWGAPHHEPALKCRDACIAYCSKKDDTYIDGPKTFGKNEGGQGSRSDLSGSIKRLREGATLKDLASDDIGAQNIVKYSRGLRELEVLLNPSKYRPDLKVTVVWGQSGTGKTEWAIGIDDPNLSKEEKAKMVMEKNVFVKETEDKWFDNYSRNKVLVIDEFNGWLNREFFLRVIDVYPINLPVKNGFVPGHYEEVVITTNTWPEHWYPNMYWAAIERRVTKWCHFSKEERVYFENYQNFKQACNPTGKKILWE